MKPYITFLSLMLVAFWGKTQTTPQLVQQINFETGLDEVLSSERQKAFLVISGDNYTLVNQSSKIQLGTLVFDAGSWGAQGVGKTAFWGDSSILISTAFALLQANPISGRIDTFFNQNKYPEMIENFMVWPDDEDKILIHTKTYPLKKDSSITCWGDNEDSRDYLDAVNSKLYLYDAKTKTTVQVANTPHLITAFAPQLYNGQLLAGTLTGNVVQISSDLQQTTLLNAFDTSIHQLLACGEYIAVVPAGAPRLVGLDYGDERICFYKDGKRIKELTFDQQEPVDKWSMVGASATVFRSFYNAQKNSVLVNYGFSRLVNINLTTFDTIHYPIPYNMAKFYCFGSNEGQLLAAMDTKQNAFASARFQGMFDLENKKFQPAFKKIDEQDKYTQYYKTFDDKGNYHIVAYKGDYSSDSLFIYSSNKTQPVRIGCQWCKLTFDATNNILTMQKYNEAKAGYLLYNKMRQSNYTLDFNTPSEIIEPIFDTEEIAKEKLPETVNGVYQLNNALYFITGTKYKKEKTYFDFLVADTSGKILIEEREHEFSLTNNYALSPSKRYLAIAFNEKNKYRLTVWDLHTMNKVFETKTDKAAEVRHYTFDKTKDVLWYAIFKYDKNTDSRQNQVFSVELNNPKPAAKPEFDDDRFFSFEVDMAADRVAFEAYSEIYVAQLSTRKVLWQKTPRQNYYEVGHIDNGFSFSTGKEFHTLTHDTTYMYFTTYNGGKAVEVANNYLYKGEKSSINNLAFVYNNNGFLPADYDVYFNRPDTVLVLAGSTNQEFNTLMNEAFAKRKRKLASVDINSLLTKSPQVMVVNKSNLPFVVSANTIALDVVTKSKYANIVTLHIIANGVPVFGETGLLLSPNKNISISQSVQLQKGNNTIQISVVDAEGIPSSTETINIVAEYQTPEPKTYFVGIGIDKFKEAANNLSYSVKDIRDFAIALKNKLGEALIIDTLFNQNVTVSNVLALREKLLQTGVNDRVIVSYSGHGLLNKNFDYYLSTYNINFRKPEDGGLPYASFERLLDSLPARKKLLLIDACHSGEVDREELDRMQVAFADTTQSLKNGSKSGIELLFDEEQTVGLKNSFELMQEVFVDVGRGTGTTVISAAAGTQVAYEKGELKNGVFTYCVLQMLNEQPNCTVQELKTHVSTEVERLTNGLQKPTSRNETAGFDWQVW